MSDLTKDELVNEIIKILNIDGEEATDGECLELVGTLLEAEGYQVYPFHRVTDIECPTCHSPIGQWCVGPNGDVRGGLLLTHPDRTREITRRNYQLRERVGIDPNIETPIS